jgi:hypothetical protein
MTAVMPVTERKVPVLKYQGLGKLFRLSLLLFREYLKKCKIMENDKFFGYKSTVHRSRVDPRKECES